MNNNTIAEPSGILLINKPASCTSHDVVNKIRRLFNTRRVGHTGTLDPMATGVLVVLVGSAVKASEYMLSGDKRYSATMHLGETSDTEDSTGKILSHYTGVLPPESEVHTAVSGFVGSIMQTPPMYSALKINGKKLVDIARAGGNIEREAREITVYSIECKRIEDADYRLDVHCSGGTYIRTICADIGQKLGCGGLMSSLCRTEACGFSLSDAVTLEALIDMSFEKRINLLLPTENLFSDLPVIHLPAFYERLCRNGCEIYQKKLGLTISVGKRVRLYGERGFFALGEAFDYPDGCAVKAIKYFI